MVVSNIMARMDILLKIVAFTAVGNLRSRAVMERIGMTRRPEDDFDHPSLPEGHRMMRHVLYRKTRRGAVTPRGRGGAA